MASAISERTVSPKDAKVLIKRCMEVGRPVFIWAPPGVGKSDLIQEIGREQNRKVIDIRLLLLEPTDLKGIPYYDSHAKSMRWAKPSELPGNEIESPDLQDAILFLDELNAAPQSVQAAAYQLMLNKRIGEYVLPEKVSIVCAGNRETDRGVTFRMPSPLANRLIHLEMTTKFDDWQQWAIQNKIHPDVIGFLSHHKQHLFNFDPKTSDKAFATPRSWSFVSDLIADVDDSLITTLVAGTVGEGIAIEFAQHCRISAKMPKPDDILTGRETKLNVKEISAMFSLTIAMCYTLKEWVDRTKEPDTKFTMVEWHKCVDHFLNFMMSNFQTEMIVLGAKTALREYKLPIQHHILKSFKKFNEQFGDLILEN